jgi:hypothetical protein
MKLSDMFFIIMYGSAFFLVLYFFMNMSKGTVKPVTNVIVYEDTPVYDTVWPWYTPYNYWPTWVSWGGGDYSYGRRRHIPHRRPVGPIGGIHTRPYGGRSSGRGMHSGPRTMSGHSGSRRR